MDPLVSILLPVYNGEPFIAATLESVLGQTYHHLEVIVVDDGSRDRTRAIVEARAADDPRVKVIGQTNRGLAATRNRALAEARGEFVAPVDADDLWDPTKIERQVRRAREGGDGIGLVYCWWIWIDAEGRVMDASPRWRIEGDAVDALLTVNFVGNSSVPFFRRSVLQRAGGYDETLPMGCEDWDVALKVAELSRIAVVPAPLVGYRWHRNNMSGKTDAMWRSHAGVLTGARARGRRMSAAAIRRSEDQFALYLAGVSFRSGARRAAVRWGLRALRSGVAFRILPYVARLFWRRMAPPDRARRSIRPGVSFAGWDVPEAPIPYDRIYARRFDRFVRRDA